MTDPLTCSQQSKSEGLLLDVEAVSSWVSIRANTAVFENKFYYECQIMTAGIM